jgi:ATP-dependent Zn protease
MENLEIKIRECLGKKLKDTKYDKANMIDERCKQLINIHRSWILFAQHKQTPEQMAEVLFKYEQNLK